MLRIIGKKATGTRHLLIRSYGARCNNLPLDVIQALVEYAPETMRVRVQDDGWNLLLHNTCEEALLEECWSSWWNPTLKVWKWQIIMGKSSLNFGCSNLHEKHTESLEPCLLKVTQKVSICQIYFNARPSYCLKKKAIAVNTCFYSGRQSLMVSIILFKYFQTAAFYER